MAGIPYTYYLEINGKCIAEIDCELSAELDGSQVVVTGVYADHLGGDTYVALDSTRDLLFVMLSERIATAAEKSEAFCAEVYEREGLFYSGGANNPTAHFKRYG